jgi:hypothetical protein
VRRARAAERRQQQLLHCCEGRQVLTSLACDGTRGRVLRSVLQDIVEDQWMSLLAVCGPASSSVACSGQAGTNCPSACVFQLGMTDPHGSRTVSRTTGWQWKILVDFM